MDLVDPAQAIKVLVEQDHLGFHALGDPRGVPPDVAGAQHHHARRPHARGAAKQHAASAMGAFEEVRTDLGGHASGDFAHRRKQRQRPIRQLDGFVRNGRGAGIEEGAGHLGIRGEVQVGEQD